MNRYKNTSKVTQIFYAGSRKYVLDPNDVVILPEEIGLRYGFLTNIGAVSTPDVAAKKKTTKE